MIVNPFLLYVSVVEQDTVLPTALKTQGYSSGL